jgi:hypothetical protein
MTLHPADLAVSSPNPVLMVDVRLLIGRSERRLAVRPKPFRVLRMHPLHEVLDRYFIGGDLENFLKARIPRANAANRIVLPPPELRCVESELQTVFARLQVVRLSRGSGRARPVILRNSP